MDNKIQVALYRGYTHGEFAFAPNSPIAHFIGNWCRQNLAEREFIPEGRRWNKATGRVEWTYKHWELKRLYCFYNKETCRLHVPAAFCDEIKQEIEAWGATVAELKLPDYEPRNIATVMNPKFTDRDRQIPLIEKLSTLIPGAKGLQLQTGGGKTYIAIKSGTNVGKVPLIIVPGLVNQWIDNIAEYTNARIGENIYKLEGFESFALLAKNPNYRPDWFVASARTMQMFANKDEGYELLPWDYTQFFKVYGIGIKIIDECHKQFHATTMADLKSNVPYNWYLSATFDQTSTQVKKIFNRVFDESKLIRDEEYVKYVTVVWHNFTGEVQEKRCSRAKGYMHALYERELMKSNVKLDTHVRSLFVPLLNQYYINTFKPGHKCLVFCSTIEFVEAVVQILKTVYPDKKIDSYTAMSTRSVLDTVDIAVSTIGKSSTGLDWKGLHCCLNTVSVRSSVLTSQMLGRLRKINGEDLVYVDLCDTNLTAHRRHAETRKDDLRRMAAKFYEYNGFNDPSVQDGTIPNIVF